MVFLLSCAEFGRDSLRDFVNVKFKYKEQSWIVLDLGANVFRNHISKPYYWIIQDSGHENEHIVIRMSKNMTESRFK